MERSTSPPGRAAPIAFSSSRRSYGYGGGTKGSCTSGHHVARELAERRVIEPHPQPHGVVVRLLAEDLALPVHRGQDVAALVRDGELHDVREGAEPGGDGEEQV